MTDTALTTRVLKTGVLNSDVVASRSGSTAPARGLWTIVVGALLPLGLLALWWAVTAAHLVPAYRLPSPGDVLVAGIDLAQRGLLYTDVAISIQRVLIGFVLGSVIGLVLGSVVGLSRAARALLSPTLTALRAIPSLAWLPLLLLYLGIFEPPKIVLITIGASFPVLTSLAGALRHVDPQLVEVGRAFGLGRLALLATVQLPAVLPALVSGLRLALAQAWLFLVAAELLNSSIGLGFLLEDSSQNGRVDRVFLAIVLLAVLGTVSDGLVGILERWLFRRWA